MKSPSLGTVYAALMTAHDVSDHVIQTDHQAANKAGPGWVGARAMAGHVGGYTVAQVLALRAVGVPLLSWRTLAGVALSAASHAFLDRRWPVTRVMELTGSAGFAFPQVRVVRLNESNISTGPLPIHGPYVVDQALHHGFLFAAARIIAGGVGG